MTDRPILFSAPMVRALLGGRKTQTRRVISTTKKPMASGQVLIMEGPRFGGRAYRFSPRFVTGDRLYVREAWRTVASYDGIAPRDLPVGCLRSYEADYASQPNDGCRGKFRQGMHMPRWASRLTLLVTEVRVQRLQDISEEDAKAEGVREDPLDTPLDAGQETNRQLFADLWDSLNAGRGFGWAENPWVCATSFRVEKINIDKVTA